MIRSHVIRPHAHQLLYFEGQGGSELALQFLAAVNGAIALLSRHPEAGSPRPLGVARLQGLRSWPVPGFDDIRIYYLVSGRAILRIIRILHGKQDVQTILTRRAN